MKTPHNLVALLILIGAALLQPQMSMSQTVASPTGKTVTVVKVKAPWYGFGFMLKGAFEKSIPTYQAIKGLQFKYYHYTDTPDSGRVFGGIYLWQQQADAERWFSPAWHERVRRERNTEGRVAYYELITETSYVPEAYPFDKEGSNSVTLFVHNATPALIQRLTTGTDGLWRLYVVKETVNQGALLLFATEDKAKLFVQKQGITGHELYYTPVLLKNH